MKTVGVECRFTEDGAVQVRKVLLDGRWQSAGQGRQWLDANGRHVLIMLPGKDVREIIFRPDTMVWQLVEKKHSPGGTAV